MGPWPSGEGELAKNATARSRAQSTHEGNESTEERRRGAGRPDAEVEAAEMEAGAEVEAWQRCRVLK
jgi:hypothetical protein